MPHLNRIQTIEEAYIFHKERRQNLPVIDERPECRFGELSKTFIDMALWVGDSEMYELAALWTNRQTNLYATLVAQFPQRQQYMLELKAWKRLREVFEINDRDCYVAELACRVDKNGQILKEKYLIGH